MGDRLRAGIPSRYVTSQVGRLSLASLQGRLIEYQLRLCDPMWYVSSHSSVATMQTAIHLLLTYLLVCHCFEGTQTSLPYASVHWPSTSTEY